MVLDPLRVDEAENQINAFIERRAREREKQQAVGDLWAISERKHHEAEQAALRQQWVEHHLRQADALEKTAQELAEEHRLAAQRLQNGGAF